MSVSDRGQVLSRPDFVTVVREDAGAGPALGAP